MSESFDDGHVFIVVTKMCRMNMHFIVLMIESLNLDRNAMEWPHPHPLHSMHHLVHPIGLHWHLTQNNGQTFDHSIFHNKF